MRAWKADGWLWLTGFRPSKLAMMEQSLALALDDVAAQILDTFNERRLPSDHVRTEHRAVNP